MKKEIILASNNDGKIKEFNDYFKNSDIKIIPQTNFNIPSAKEPYSTFVENALEKAKNIYANKKINGLVLADDSGICSEALNGMPGVISARYANLNKSSKENNKKLDLELKNHSNKKVYYVCILVLLKHFQDPDPIITHGRLDGLWISTSSGNNGFGYDPHFFLPQYNKTLGQLDLDIKNKISHRSMALKKMLEIINKLNLI